MINRFCNSKYYYLITLSFLFLLCYLLFICDLQSGGIISRRDKCRPDKYTQYQLSDGQTNNNTSFVDLSQYGVTAMTRTGQSANYVLTGNGQSKFRGLSIQFPNAQFGYLSHGNVSTITCVTGSNWTVEFWLYLPSSSAAYQGVIGQSKATSTYNGWEVSIYDTKMNCAVNGANSPLTNAGTYNYGSWSHIAVVKINGENWHIYRNGTLASDQIASSAYASSNTSDSLKIGKVNLGSGYMPANSYMSNVRISNIARYTAVFTVPNKPF